MAAEEQQTVADDLTADDRLLIEETGRKVIEPELSRSSIVKTDTFGKSEPCFPGMIKEYTCGQSAIYFRVVLGITCQFPAFVKNEEAIVGAYPQPAIRRYL